VDLTYDPNAPEDYLMRLNASKMSKNPEEQVQYYNMLLAQKALQGMQQTTNPLQADLEARQKAYDEGRAAETSSDNAALEAYKKQLEIDYAQKIADAQAQ